jgi:hypothetical protein
VTFFVGIRTTGGQLGTLFFQLDYPSAVTLEQKSGPINTICRSPNYTSPSHIPTPPRVLKDNRIKHIIQSFENKIVDVPGSYTSINISLLSRANRVSSTLPSTLATHTTHTHTTQQPPKTHTYSIEQLLMHRHHKHSPLTNTQHTTQITTIKTNNNTIQRYNNIINNTKHTLKKKTFKIPTFNTKFSLRGSSLAETASENQPGGQWISPPGLGGELVAIRGLHQESSAPLSMANSQQESSTLQLTNSQTHKQTKKQKYKKIATYWRKKHTTKTNTTKHTSKHEQQQPHKHTASTNTNSNTTTTTQQETQATTTPTKTQTQIRAGIGRAKQSKKKGRAHNKWNSKQRKIIKANALEGLPSGDPGQPRGFAFCGDQMTQAIPRKRNSKRGLRSKQKIEERKTKRSFKRREARRRLRTEGQANKPIKQKKANSASAQEPLKRIKIELGKEIHIATLNIRGSNKLGKREEVEDWMKANNISILALQETKSPHSKRETRKDYIW